MPEFGYQMHKHSQRRYSSDFVELTVPNDELIRQLSYKLLRAENPSVIIAVAEQLKIAIDAYVRERTLQIPAIKEIASR